eukprot:CAMPEP_0194763644 /NCGR_PEP_ID=MMETSP0323_2-20130528/20141_1 /TAXON_ID=2866 ORGANISM="Crypthecodinium cohnii, Strain Seligo" /NCGR_SAMPLE_ID=MMETSP0323_2 /ASSEMBLY_ACC=CAM_ASM_000346 /LENGTH=32 /DNA_ID= /DNA_START= /DNA_END= /DNA_ORIENTATION=
MKRMTEIVRARNNPTQRVLVRDVDLSRSKLDR